MSLNPLMAEFFTPVKKGMLIFKDNKFLTPNKKANLFFVENLNLSEQSSKEYPFILLQVVQEINGIQEVKLLKLKIY